MANRNGEDTVPSLFLGNLIYYRDREERRGSTEMQVDFFFFSPSGNSRSFFCLFSSSPLPNVVFDAPATAADGIYALCTFPTFSGQLIWKRNYQSREMQVDNNPLEVTQPTPLVLKFLHALFLRYM